MAADIRTLKLNLLADIDNFQKGMSGATTSTTKFDKHIATVTKNIARGFAIAGAAVTAFSIKLGKDSIQAASDFSEAQSKVEAVFASQADEIKKWAKTTGQAFGVSTRAAMEAAGTYGNLFQAFGIGQKQATVMSKRLVELAADMASFNNVPIDEALTALRSGLSGETEPLKRFGVALNDARLKQEALDMGLINSAKGTLPIAIKAQAAYALILKDTALQQGDVARTSDGLANQTKFLSAAWEDAKASLGEALLPVAINFVKFLNQTFIPVVKEVIDGFKGAAGAAGIAQAADEVAHRLGERDNGLTATARNLAAAFGDSNGLTPMARNLQAAFGSPSENTSGQNLGAAIYNLAEQFGKLFKTITEDGPDGISILDSIADSLNKIARAIELVGNMYNAYKNSPIGKLFGTNWGEALMTPGIQWTGVRAAGGSVTAGQAYRVGEFGPETFIPNASGRVVRGNSGQNITINMNGVIDGESARRTIEKLLQDSARRTGAINLLGATL